MKKIVILLLFAIIYVNASANVAVPRAYISEIHVDSAGNWSIELGFHTWDIAEVDSIRIITSSGSSMVTSWTYLPAVPGSGWDWFDSLAVITNANLTQPLSINGSGDFVKVLSYTFYGQQPFDSVAFGNMPGSFLDCIHEGEAVSYLNYQDSWDQDARSFTIDHTPSISITNDSAGALGTFSGTFYDPEGIPVGQGFFNLLNAVTPPYDYKIVTIDAGGSFCDRTFARRYSMDTVTVYLGTAWPYTAKTFSVEQVDFCLQPDSVHHQDILATGVVNGINDGAPGYENSVTVSPNPFRSATKFYFNLQRFDPEDVLQFSIYDRAGKLLVNLPLTRDQSAFEWTPSSSAAAGLYFYSLQRNNHPVKTGKLIRLQD